MTDLAPVPERFTLPEPIRLGAFELRERIGVGGMGEIWRAVHPASREQVAVKVLTAVHAREPEFVAAFTGEVRAAAGLDHPNVVMVLDHGEVTAEADEASGGFLTAGSPFLVMELADGGWLRPDRVNLSWTELQGLLAALLDALAHAHARGIVHRDLKPENVLRVAPSDPWTRAKVTDFGIAHAADHLDPDAPQDPLSGAGTPHYMPPEQVRGRWRDQGPWTDLYALGCLAWEVATGRSPFEAPSNKAICDMQLHAQPPAFEPRRPVPDGFEAWLRRLLEKAPDARYTRAADALYRLSQLRLPEGADDAGEADLDLGSEDDRTRSTAALSLTIPSSHSPGDTGESVAIDVGAPPEVPPLPASWRRTFGGRPPRLVGAGMGLFGLRTIPLAGREKERDVLWSALSTVCERGEPRLVVIRGASGLGKSRLVEWTTRRAHEVGAASVLKVTHAERPGPGDGLEAAIARDLRLTGLNAELMRMRLQRSLAREGVDDPWEARALGSVLAGEPVAGARGSADPRLALLERVVRRSAARRPLVLWLDDVHWGRESLALSAHLATALSRQPAPVLVVATAQDEALAERPEERAWIDRLGQRSGTITMRLSPLTDDAMRDLVQGLLLLDDALADRVIRRVGGNPSFAVQIVGDWIERGVLGVGERGFVLHPGQEATLPDDLHAVWASRIQRVLADAPIAERRALEVAGALGDRVDSWEWHVACVEAGVPGRLAEVAVTLRARLVTSRLARESGQELAFETPMLRESLERLSREAGRWVSDNLACAAMLGKCYPIGGADVAERLARHFMAAERWEDALEPLLDAAERCRERGWLAAGHEHLRQRDRAMLEARVPETDPRWGRGWIARSRLHLLATELDEAARWAEAATNQAGVWSGRQRVTADPWSAVRADALETLGQVARQRGEPQHARQLLEEARELYAALGDERAAGRCQLGLGELAGAAGDFDEATDRIVQALAVFEALGSGPDRADALQALGEVAHTVGDAESAANLFEQARALHEEAADALGAAESLLCLAEVARGEGMLDDAEALYHDALRALERVGADGERARANLGLVLVQRGRFAESLDALEAAIAALEGSERRALLGSVHACALVGRAATGDEAGFDHDYARARELLTATATVEPDVAWTAQLAGDLLAAADDRSRAERAYRLALDQWTALGRDDRVEAVERALAAL